MCMHVCVHTLLFPTSKLHRVLLADVACLMQPIGWQDIAGSFAVLGSERTCK